MRQILYLRKLNQEKVLTDEEYQSAIQSYVIDMNSEQFIEAMFVLITASAVTQLVCEMFNGINKNDV